MVEAPSRPNHYGTWLESKPPPSLMHILFFVLRRRKMHIYLNKL